LQRRFATENSVSIIPFVLLLLKMAVIQITLTKFVNLGTGDELCGMERGVDMLIVEVNQSILMGRKIHFVSVLDGTLGFVYQLLYSMLRRLIPVNEGRMETLLMRVVGTIYSNVPYSLVIVNRIPLELKIMLKGK
jgi:hypothetical protein